MMRTAPLNSRILTEVTPAGCPNPCDLPMHLAYDTADPYAVRAQFEVTPGNAGVIWFLSRELLWEGLNDRVGGGDTIVEPYGPHGQTDQVTLRLTSPDGHAVVAVPRKPLTDFLRAVYRAVPAGSEYKHLDLDGVVASLLGPPAAT